MKISVQPVRRRASIRLSHQYEEGWREFDRYDDRDWAWRLLGTARRRNLDPDSITVVYSVRASRPVTRKEMALAMAAAFNHGCRCEHDCCGHVQWRVMTHLVRRAKRREWHVPIVGVRNV